MTANLLSLSSHTIDESLLPERPMVLDVGARGFEFTREVLALRPWGHVVALEPDPAVENPRIQGCEFLRAALVHDDRHESGYASFSTGEGNFLSDEPIHYAKMLRVACVGLKELGDIAGVQHWDVVKLDCEGAEFAILENWPGPIATQISVEFHDYTDLKRWDDGYFARLFGGPLKDYRVVQHAATPVGPGRNVGHWDSLLVLKRGSA